MLTITKSSTVNLTLCSKCQIDGEDIVDFCGLLGKRELYIYYFFHLILVADDVFKR